MLVTLPSFPCDWCGAEIPCHSVVQDRKHPTPLITCPTCQGTYTMLWRPTPTFRIGLIMKDAPAAAVQAGRAPRRTRPPGD